MPRTLNATLEAALDAGNYSKPIIRGWLGNEQNHQLEVQVISYTLKSTSLKVQFYTANAIDIGIGGTYEEFALERGLEINNTEYTVFTMSFQVTRANRIKKIYTAECEIGNNKSYTAAGDVTYETAINAWGIGLSNAGVVPAYQNASANWLSYNFLPAGKQILLNKNTSFLNMLAQKYFIFFTDDQGETPLVFSVDDTYKRSTDHIIAITDADIFNFSITNKTLRWIDETGSYNLSSALALQVHNLGYLETTATYPIVTSQSPNSIARSFGNPIVKKPFHLKYLTGDKVTFQIESLTIMTTVLEVTEILDPNSDIAWRVELSSLDYLSNTEGGALPSTIERVSNYTPLNASGFNGNLDSSVNNLQAFAEKVDSLTITNPPATTAVNDFQIGNSSVWVRTSLTNTITILRSVLNGIYAALSHTHTHASTTGQGTDDHHAKSHVHTGDGSGTVAYSSLSGRPTIREVLTATRTYYVRTDGSDSNTGLTNTSGGAFLTIQKAVDTIATLDISGYTVTIQVADGTYTGTVSLKNVVGAANPGNLVIQGNNSTPANVVISTTSNNCFFASGVNATWDIKDMKLTTTTSGSCISASLSKIRFGNIEFGACATYHISTNGTGTLAEALSNYTVNGGATRHWSSIVLSEIRVQSITITLSGTPAFTDWAHTETAAVQLVNANTYSGSATGKRYNVAQNSVVFSGATLPGDVAGTTATGGQYI